MNDLHELLENIYSDIRSRNTDANIRSIPMSDEFYDKLSESYNLIPFAIPKLIKILVDSHKIFSFTVVEADRSERVRRIEGFVAAEGNIINALVPYFKEQMISSYSHEFHKKINAENIIKELVPIIKNYNNTELGRFTNIVLNLLHCSHILETKIMEYGPNWQSKRLEKEVQGSDPISYFVNEQGPKTAAEKKRKDDDRKTDEKKRRAVDSEKYDDFKKFSSKHSIEKTLGLYGVEFYTRVCFREYQFSHVLKLIDNDVIKEKDDLMIIKKFLQKERSNSDRDLRLQDFAQDINRLEKCINDRLKQGHK